MDQHPVVRVDILHRGDQAVVHRIAPRFAAAIERLSRSPNSLQSCDAKLLSSAARTTNTDSTRGTQTARTACQSIGRPASGRYCLGARRECAYRCQLSTAAALVRPRLPRGGDATSSPGSAGQWIGRTLFLRAEALRAAAVLAWAQGDLDRAEADVEESIPLYRALGDDAGLGRIAHHGGTGSPRTAATLALAKERHEEVAPARRGRWSPPARRGRPGQPR